MLLLTPNCFPLNIESPGDMYVRLSLLARLYLSFDEHCCIWFQSRASTKTLTLACSADRSSATAVSSTGFSSVGLKPMRILSAVSGRGVIFVARELPRGSLIRELIEMFLSRHHLSPARFVHFIKRLESAVPKASPARAKPFVP